MTWFKVDDGFYDHPKVHEIGLQAVGLWVLAGSWCAKHLTDGVISVAAIRRLGGTTRQANALVSAGLWLKLDANSYRFKDWMDYQPLREDVLKQRSEAKARMAEIRARRKGVHTERESERSDDVRSPSVRNPRPVPSYPDPTNTPNGVSTHEPDPTTRIGAAFTQVWEFWPRAKIGQDSKSRAWAAFHHAVNQSFNGRIANLVTAMQAWAAAWEETGDSAMVCPGIARWINDEKWNDPLPSRPVQNSGQQRAQQREAEYQNTLDIGRRLQQQYDQQQAEQRQIEGGFGSLGRSI